MKTVATSADVGGVSPVGKPLQVGGTIAVALLPSNR